MTTIGTEKCIKCDKRARRFMNSRERYCEEHYQTEYVATRCTYPYVSHIGQFGSSQCRATATTTHNGKRSCTRHSHVSYHTQAEGNEARKVAAR